MQTKTAKIFDECLRRIKRGEAVKACLAEYQNLRQQLVPLLHTAVSIAAIPKVVPSNDFRAVSKARIMLRLRERALQGKKLRRDGPFSALRRGLENVLTGPARIAIPLTLGVVLVLQLLLFFGTVNVASPLAAPALASRCTLNIFTGGVQLQTPGSSTWEEASNGMTLEAGYRVKTGPNAQATLTFFNGSTITLESGTDLMVKQMEYDGEKKPAVIVLKQWVGKTLSRVTKLTDAGSRYEIQTPSAIALVRGTQFVTAVDEKGLTTVQTIEGLVSVSGEGKEVYLPAGQQTTVEPGTPPSEPVPVSYSKSENPPAQAQEEPSQKILVTGPSSEGTQPPKSPGQDTKIGGPGEQGKEGLTAKSPGNEQLPVLGQGKFSWVGQYDKWMVAYFVGLLLFVLIATVLILRKR